MLFSRGAHCKVPTRNQNRKRNVGVVHNCSMNVLRIHVRAPPTPPRGVQSRREDEEEEEQARWEVVSWGDTSHLTGKAEGLKSGFGGTRDST